MSPGRTPRSMTPIPPSSESTTAIAARVIVSIFAEISWTLNDHVHREPSRQVHCVRIAARQNPMLWSEQKIVERASTDKRQQIHAYLSARSLGCRVLRLG